MFPNPQEDAQSERKWLRERPFGSKSLYFLFQNFCVHNYISETGAGGSPSSPSCWSTGCSTFDLTGFSSDTDGQMVVLSTLGGDGQEGGGGAGADRLALEILNDRQF